MIQTQPPHRPGLISWAEVVALGVIWGAGFLAVRIALEGIAPAWVATGRVSVAALTLALLLAVLRIPLPPLSDRRIWAHVAGFAFFSHALPFMLMAWAQQHVQSSFVGVTMALVPLFTLVLAHVFLPDEKLTLPRIAGFALGLVGVVMLIGTEGVSLGEGVPQILPRLACVAVTLCYAIGSIIARRSPRVDPIAYTAASVLLACAAMLPLTLALEGLPAWPGLRPALALGYVGLLPTALASLLMVHVIRTAGPTFLTQTNYQVPVWSVIFGMLILAEPLPPQFLLALALILGGLAVSRLALRR
ncbi:MAG: DMT family transporter [Proteobacteria bacterium]|nr:DMT family transporter [Pseudomonadota bacterium]